MRISNQWITNSFLRSINKNYSELSKTEIQISSGKQITTPSENPINNALAMQHKTEINANSQYIKNIERTTEWLNNTDGALTTIETILQRARELAVQGANDTLVQQDRDAIAIEIDQLLQEIVTVGNTNVGGDFIFAGNDTATKPFEFITGQNAGTMKDIVTYSDGTIRSGQNLSSLLDVMYKGDDKDLITEIEKGVTLSKNVNGADVFFRGLPISQQPTMETSTPPISESLPLGTLNSGRGVQKGVIILTDTNGIEFEIDLTNANRLEDVIYSINSTRSFEAGIDEVPSETATALGLNRNAGTASTLIGLSDPQMTSKSTLLSSLNQGTGVPEGFLSIYTRDGRNIRIDISGASTVGDIVDLISAAGDGGTLKGRYDQANHRLEITDLTSGPGEFSIDSRRNQLYVKDLPPHTAEDLGIIGSVSGTHATMTATGLGIQETVPAGGTIRGNYDSDIQSAADPLRFMNNGMGVDLGNIVLDMGAIQRSVNLSACLTMQDVVDTVNTVGAGLVNAQFNTTTRILEITDISGGGSNFRIIDGGGSVGNWLSADYDPAVKSADDLLQNMNQGAGVERGFLRIWHTDGTSAQIDLTSAKTMQEVVDAIEAQDGANVDARFNTTSLRLEVRDRTGGAGALSIEEVSQLPATSAEDLGIKKMVNAGQTIISNLDAALQSINTPLSNLNNGGGVDLGSIRVTHSGGSTATVSLLGAVTVNDVINRINAQSGGIVTASYNAVTNRIEIRENGATGAGVFKIEEMPSGPAVSAREISTVADALGLLKFSEGTTLVGNRLSPSGLLETSSLSLLVPPPEIGNIVLRGGDDKPVTIDLTTARTIGDVLTAINNSGKFSAVWDTVNNRFVLRDTSAVVGDAGIRGEEETNTARDLGFLDGSMNYTTDVLTGGPLAVKGLPTLVGSEDLEPAVTESTLLADLNCGRTLNKGTNLGFIRITDKAGNFKAIDLRNCSTIKDVLDAINDPANGLYIEAKINSSKNGIEIADQNRGAKGKLEIVDVDTTTALDLGIAFSTYDQRIVGKDIDPAVSRETLISSLKSGSGGVPLSKVYVQSGDYSGEIDLAGCVTVGELLDKLSGSDNNLDLTAWVDSDGKRINLTNTAGLPYIKVRDLGEPDQATASALGLGGDRSIFETMMDLRDNLLRNDPKAISDRSIAFISEDLERVLDYHAEVGAKTNRADASKEKQQNLSLHLNNLLDVVENVDMTEAITRMTQLETAFQAALQAGSTILQTTLLDFLR